MKIKHFLFSVFIVFLFSILFLSIDACKKKSDSPQEYTNSYVNIDGITYLINNGIYYSEYNETNSYYEVYILLYSGFTNVKNWDGYNFDAEGIGNFIWLTLHCPEPLITAHNYIQAKGGLYYCGEAGCAGNFNNQSGTSENAAESLDDGIGVISITKEGETYSITINFNAEKYFGQGSGKEITITGFFQGKISLTQ